MAVDIRSAGSADVPELLALYQQLYPELDVHVADSEAAAIWREIDAAPGRRVLVAEEGGDVVGTVEVTIVPNLARGGRPFAVVENVVVDLDHRRRGIGRQLLAAAEALGRRSGCYKVQLSADDPEAFAFYESVGLEATARTYKRYLDDDGDPAPPVTPTPQGAARRDHGCVAENGSRVARASRSR